MESLSEDIRRKRESKNMTIEDLCEKTKISVAVLKDIEDGKFDRYQGDEAYVKMYLKKISNVLDMDSEELTQQYYALTKEIELEQLREKKEAVSSNEKVVEKGKKFSFEAPHLARKPSVYEDKSHVAIIRAVVILLLVCMVIAIVWWGFYSTRSQTNDPAFVQPNTPTVEGEVPSNEPTDNDTDDSPAQTGVTITKKGTLDFHFTLPENTETFTFKIEFSEKSWAQLTVNNQLYDGFDAKIYHNNDSSEPEIVEVELKVSDFNDLILRNGYSMGQRYYINNQEVPLEDEDYSNGATDLHLTLDK